MRANICRYNLVKALGKVAGAVKADSTLAILSNVLIEANGNKLFFTATNLEIKVIAWLEAEIEEVGRVTVNAKRLFDIVKNFNGDNVAFELEQTTLHISCDKAKVKLFGLDAKDFPEYTESEKSITFNIDSVVLTKAFKSVEHAVAVPNSDPRKALQGIYVHAENGVINFVGVDGKRLANFAVNMEVEDFKMIVPQSTTNQLLKIAESGNVIVSVHESHVSFAFESITLKSRIIEEIFPPWRQVVPKEARKYSIEIPVRQMSQTVKSVSSVLSETDYFITLKLSESELTIKARSRDFGFYNDSFALQSDAEINLCLNPVFFLEALNGCTEKTAIFKSNGDSSPVVIEDGKGYMAVLMPMRGKE